MNNYVDLLEKVKKEIDSNNTFVDDNYVLKASYFCRKCIIENIDDAFLVFASFNYLNFAVKQEGYKKLIGYFFKSKLSNLIRKCIELKLPIKMKLSTDRGMMILYASFDGFIYSFHNASIDEDLKDKLNDDIRFDFVYKQKAAAFILKEAMKSEMLSVDIKKLAKSKLEE